MADGNKSNCEKCAKQINLRSGKPINCDGDCDMVFHAVCVGLNAIRYDEIEKNSGVFWFCDSCKQKRNHRRSAVMASTSQKTPSFKSTTPTTKVSGQIDINTIYDMFKNLQTDMADIKRELCDYKNITQQLTNENVNLHNENDKLKNRISNVEYYIESKKQHDINNNILVCGIPQTETERLDIIVQSLGTALAVEIRPTDVEIAYRKRLSGTNSSGLPSPIVIKFNNQKVKEAVMAAKTLHKIDTNSLSITEINQIMEKRPIYISDQLTRHKQFIYKCARDLKKENKIAYAWTKKGEILVRKTENSPTIIIKHQEQLNDI